jgi:hypothetical protein
MVEVDSMLDYPLIKLSSRREFCLPELSPVALEPQSEYLLIYSDGDLALPDRFFDHFPFQAIGLNAALLLIYKIYILISLRLIHENSNFR